MNLNIAIKNLEHAQDKFIKNPYSKKELLTDIYNDISYPFGVLLLKFIYNEYEKIFNKIYDILKNNNDITEDLIESILNCIDDKTQYSDPYLFLLKCEISNLNVDSFINFKKIIENKLKRFTHLQDFYYEAINLCFNINHEKLKKYTINQRISFYYNSPSGLNVIRDFTKYTSYTEKYVIHSLNKDIPKDFNKTPETCLELFDNDNDTYFSRVINTKIKDIKKLEQLYYSLVSSLNYIDETPTTDFMSRKMKTTYDEKENKIIYSLKKDYNITLPNNLIKLDDSLIDIYKTIEFNNVLSLCNYEFNKLLEFRDNIIIKECKICKKLFITTDSRKEYCDNKFTSSKYNGVCSDENVGKKIAEKINKSPLDIKTSKILRRLKDRSKSNTNNILKNDTNALQDFQDIKKLFDKSVISKTNYEKILDFFDTLKPYIYNQKMLIDYCIENKISTDILNLNKKRLFIIHKNNDTFPIIRTQKSKSKSITKKPIQYIKNSKSK